MQSNYLIKEFDLTTSNLLILNSINEKWLGIYLVNIGIRSI